MTKTVSKLTWLPKKTFELEFSLPWEQVKKTYDQVLNSVVKSAKIEGFRPGKAPQNLVEKNIDQGKLYGEVINQLIPVSYATSVTEHRLRPAVAPKITIIKAEPNAPWQFKALSCELPEVKLENYEGAVRSSLVKSKLENKELTETQKLNLIAKSLLDSVKIELSDLLIESERDRLLAKLLDQVQKLGLTIDQYAASNQKTVDQLKTEYGLTASNSLKLEIILQAIADAKKITADHKEIDKLIAASGDDKLKKQLDTPAERAYLGSVLRKRQVIDFLLKI